MRKKAEKGRVLSIFLTFLKFGCFTFGGGWSIVSQIQKEYVEDKHWITDEELLDFTSVGRSVPGLMISNASVLFGYHAAGFGGALAALAGEDIQSYAEQMFEAGADLTGRTAEDVFSSDFKAFSRGDVKFGVGQSTYMTDKSRAAAEAVVPIILCALLKLTKSALKDWLCWLVALSAAALSLFTGLSNILIVVLGAAAGLLAMEVKTRHDLH